MDACGPTAQIGRRGAGSSGAGAGGGGVDASGRPPSYRRRPAAGGLADRQPVAVPAAASAAAANGSGTSAAQSRKSGLTGAALSRPPQFRDRSAGRLVVAVPDLLVRRATAGGPAPAGGAAAPALGVQRRDDDVLADGEAVAIAQAVRRLHAVVATIEEGAVGRDVVQPVAAIVTTDFDMLAGNEPGRVRQRPIQVGIAADVDTALACTDMVTGPPSGRLVSFSIQRLSAMGDFEFRQPKSVHVDHSPGVAWPPNCSKPGYRGGDPGELPHAEGPCRENCRPGRASASPRADAWMGSPNVLIGRSPPGAGFPLAPPPPSQQPKPHPTPRSRSPKLATVAAAVPPALGLPAAKAAEELAKASAAASMGSMISGAAGGADIHACVTPSADPAAWPGRCDRWLGDGSGQRPAGLPARRHHPRGGWTAG